jgi:hypothetical protein
VCAIGSKTYVSDGVHDQIAHDSFTPHSLYSDILPSLSFLHTHHLYRPPPEFGRNAQIISFTGNRVSIRKVDGSVLFAATSSDVSLLYELTRGGRWDESLR